MTLCSEDWLAAETASLPTSLEFLSPSQWGEAHRVLTDSVAQNAGTYDYAMAPYLREIVDCLDIRSPITDVTLMKGAQLGATTGILENFLGYAIGYVKTSPVMLLTADSDMAKDRVVGHITPMIQESGLEGLIRSNDERNARRTGKTNTRIEWEGGGYGLFLGVQNPNKIRSTPVRFLLRDEIDGWPDCVGKDGDPMRLSKVRTSAFEQTRKILDLSTPLIRGQSAIETRFLEGDQRNYQVLCLRCGRAQRLRWQHTEPDTGEVTGITWETEGGTLVPESVRYLCKFCAHPHCEDDKVKLLSPAYGAHWKPTAVAQNKHHRSYHISALYSRFQSWADCVDQYLKAWDTEKGVPRDNRAYQAFYNTTLGSTFKLRGEKLRFDVVSEHRRHAYKYGEVPNGWAIEHCGSRVLLVVCTVDVQGENLAVAVWGWCRDRRVLLLSYERYEGDTEQLDNPDTWERLRSTIESAEFSSDDNRFYRIATTFIDAGFRSEQVHRFVASCEGYAVYTIKGAATRSETKDFREQPLSSGHRAFTCWPDHYKNRWSAALKRSWDGLSRQPSPFLNAPIDATDKQLKELTVEVRREKVDKATGRRLGFEWHRPSGARNELWDLLVYADCALDIDAFYWSKDLGLKATNWTAYYDALIEAAE